MKKIFREVKGKITLNTTAYLNFPAHVHDDIELVYVRRGGGTAWCDGKKYFLTPGMCFLTFPNQIHRYTDCVQGEYLLLIMKPSMLLRYQGVFMEGAPENAACPLEEESLLWLLDTARKEYAAEGFSDVIAAYLTAFFGKLLLRFPIGRSVLPRKNVQSILQYCADHCREDLTVELVAENLGVSRSCVSHIFSSRIGVNFRDYINSLRLTEAEELLRNRNYSVTEVANRTGFPTIRTFNRAFAKKHGVSPREYRKTCYCTNGIL